MTDARRLRSFVERIESLEKEIKDRNNDKRDVYGAYLPDKGQGIPPPARRCPAQQFHNFAARSSRWNLLTQLRNNRLTAVFRGAVA